MATTDQTFEDLFLPDPEPRQVKYTVISVDDHLVEPPDMFEGRLEARFADRAPVVVEDDKGHQLWEFDGGRFTQVGMNAVAGRRPGGARRPGTRPSRQPSPYAGWTGSGSSTRARSGFIGGHATAAVHPAHVPWGP